MSDYKNEWGINTKLNHPKEVKLVPGNKPVLQPIYQTAKFSPSEDHPFTEQFIYSRISNPTLRQLELTLADIQKKEDCIVMASGIAAVSGTLLALLKAGDHMITFRELYKPARVFIKDFLPKYNIEATFLSMNKFSDIEGHIKTGVTKLIYFESPSNPNLSMADIKELIRIAKKFNLLLVMDGTFGGPHQHTEFDIDVMIHSLTKYANGHGDIIAGSVAGKTEIIKQIKDFAGYFGATLDPHAANLVTRGLKTYHLRYQRQCQSALEIATYLSKHPAVKNVTYPGLETHPDFSLAKSQMRDSGGIIAFELQHGKLDAKYFCHKLQMIQFTASLGSTETLICPTLLFFGMDLSESDRTDMGMNAFSLRLSVGLEDPKDIIEDLESVLGKK
jgi:cystathionine beta-lyase/cystathionine gamma-synthase